MANKVYEIITNQLLKEMESGNLPWQRPWVSLDPQNMISGKNYRGMNTLCLWIHQTRFGFKEPEYLTLKQVLAKGGKVNYDQMRNSCMITFFSSYKKAVEKDGEEVEEDRRILRYYQVWNIEQTNISRVKREETLNDNERITIAQEWLEQAKSQLPHCTFNDDAAGAFFSPTTKDIGVPNFNKFANPVEFYSTCAHEFCHAAEDHLMGTKPGKKFGNKEYAFGELVAEIGAAFVCSRLQIPNYNTENSARYLTSWIKALKNDKTFIFKAAALAQKCVDFLFGEERNNGGDE